MAVRLCPGMGWQIFAPRQQLLRCPTKLHPCNDAISALPPSVVVVCRKEPGNGDATNLYLFIKLLREHYACNTSKRKRAV